MRNYALNYLTLIIIFIAFPSFIIKHIMEAGQINIYMIIGLVIIIPSMILFAIARINLGSSFQATAEANKLVTWGVYKRFRHPIYLFGLCFFLGLIIFLEKYYLIIPWVALIYLQRKRVQNEEKVLEEKFGNEYVEYKKGTWF